MENEPILTYGKLVKRQEGILIVPPQSFDSYKEVDHLIRYITRTRKNEKYSDDLISYGARGLEIRKDVSKAIRQWKQVQHAYEYQNKFGRHCFHEIYCLSDEFSRKIGLECMDKLAYELSTEYWNQGHQVVYGIHQPDKREKRLHIHFAVNTICLKTGKKWYDWSKPRRERNDKFNAIVLDICSE